jgi:thiosulfate reductase cytochrome b subunit
MEFAGTGRRPHGTIVRRGKHTSVLEAGGLGWSFYHPVDPPRGTASARVLDGPSDNTRALPTRVQGASAALLGLRIGLQCRNRDWRWTFTAEFVRDDISPDVKCTELGNGFHFMNASLPIADGNPAQVLQRTKPADIQKRHSAVVRLTHWLTTLAFCALLLSGGEIVLSHPRFYWGETGNVNMRPWLNLHLPSSRDTVPSGYGYVLPDQNGWSRYLHFEAAWLAVGTGLLYVLFGFCSGHFRRNLIPAGFSLQELSASAREHLRFARPGDDEASSYNVLQRMTYLLVIFILFPLMIWTGLAMSFGLDAAFPLAVKLLGGHQTARSLHFIVTFLLVIFLVVHIVMIFVAGFRSRMRAMITGKTIIGRVDQVSTAALAVHGAKLDRRTAAQEE